MKESNRNTGIELLRIVAMLAVTVLHVLGKGGVLASSDQLSLGYELAWILEIMSYFGVTVYALITGYTALEGSFYFTNIVYLWLQVFFYDFGASVLFFAFKREALSFESIKQLFFPVMNESFWYFSAYFAAFFFIPFIKKSFELMEKNYIKSLFGMIIICFSILPVFFSSIDVFSIRHGASFVWVLCCFYLGAYMKKYGLLESFSSGALWILYALMVFLTWSVKFLIEFIYGYERWNRDRGNVLLAYNSPSILTAAMALLVIFSRMHIEGRMKKLILLISPLTFGVYLSNSQPLVFENIMKDRFAGLACISPIRMVICVLLSALVIFLIGIAIDMVRRFLFEILHVREKLRVFESYILKRGNSA